MLPPPPKQDTVIATDSMTNLTLVKVRDASVISPDLLPTIPGYEVISRLGQGGMGRVFKARHLGLHRMDAIKMVSVGASPHLITRFMDEARAIARLKHPNIAQVYDSGEVDGHPFYAMELVEAGTLTQKLSRQPQEARWSARLIMTLAQAVHYFHQQGIIHRDLKPSNVLMEADGEPKIADFGLVKNIGSDSQHTETGDIIGTPSYMSPEQASGMVKSIGPASDIYALGAILYECLTGRPPFQTPDGMQTLMLVIAEEPVPPGKLVPKLPKDLDTICMKCLEKQPGRRYATAQALADDLARFLEGESIIARPVGRVEKTWKWCRRRPAWAGLILVGLLSLVGFGVGFFWLTKAYSDLSAAKKESDEGLKLTTSALHQFTTSFSSELEGIPQTEGVRIKALNDARKIFDKLISLRPRSLESRVQYVDHCQQLGSIERTLGGYDRADAAYQQAFQMLDAIIRETDALPFRAKYLSVIVQRANLEYERSQLDRCREYLQQAEPLAAKLEAINDPSSTVLHPITDYHAFRGLLFSKDKKFKEAEQEYRQALSKLQRANEIDGTSVELSEELANTHNNLGTQLLMQLEFKQAAEQYDLALDKLPQTSNPRTRNSRAMILSNQALIAEQLKDWPRAWKSYEQAATVFRGLMADFSSVPDYRFRWAKVKLNLIRSQMAVDYQKTISQIAEVEPVLQQLVKDYPQQNAFREQLKILETCKKTLEYLKKGEK
ncbi:MAG TPA: protein kinase [Gemmatales bacterium]|nr:protein kinase [Gemmatales bacterium]